MTEQRLRQMAETLQRLAVELDAELDEGRLMDRALDLANRVIPAESGEVWLVEGDEACLAVARGLTPDTGTGIRRPLADVPLVRHVVESRSPLRLDHMQADPRYVPMVPDETPQSYLAAPLLTTGRVLGSLAMRSSPVGLYDEEQERALAAFGALAGLALHNARLRQERDRTSNRLALLLRLTAIASRSLDLRQVFREFGEVLRTAVACDRLTLVLSEPGLATLRRYAVFGGEIGGSPGGTRFDPAGTSAGEVLSTRQPVVRSDLSRQKSFPRDDAFLERGVRSDAVLPLVAGGECLGVLVLASRTAGAFSPADLELLQPVAEHLALAVDHSLAHQRVLQQALRVQAINRVARLISRGLDARPIFAAFATELRALLPHDRTVFASLQTGGTHMDVMTSAAVGAEDLAARTPSVMPVAGCPAAWALEHCQALLRRDLASEATFPGEQEALALGIRSHVLLPLLVGDRGLGVLVLSSRQPEAFETSHLLLLQPLADLLAAALENARLHEAVRQQALLDPLTGLFNRRYFDDRVEPEIDRCRRLGYPLGLLFADLDGLKEINDVLGHPAGDAALRLTATTLQASLRTTDLLTRWGGDEFVMILPGQTIEGLRTVAEKLRVALASQSLFAAEDARGITISMGGAVYPAHAESAEGLVEAADRALLAAKGRGGNCCLMADDVPPAAAPPPATGP